MPPPAGRDAARSSPGRSEYRPGNWPERTAGSIREHNDTEIPSKYTLAYENGGWPARTPPERTAGKRRRLMNKHARQDLRGRCPRPFPDRATTSRQLSCANRQSGGSPVTDVAIVGLSARFPGAADLGEFWRLLQTAGPQFHEVPDSRWIHRTFYDPLNPRNPHRA
ncbi:beta-ketoacyl synthase N-terminal-like domain-containing protein, partial [Frankia sp. CiP1_Cm_nod2]|uniref:beta-ketoacyl synthase N-terminal-like domain-containing protein n=1 Tax=Frankia sp. CiP1_Cm_nod2 TaxID=2897161 RepID=UPI0040444024